MKQNPLLATKLYVPQPGSNLVERAPLVKRLESGFQSKLTLLSAPAGFGKTTLLTQWVSQHKNRTSWISLDKTVADPIVFVQYLIAALRSVVPDIGREAMGSLYSDPLPVDLICTSLINEIAEISDTLLLVLDDYHLIDNETTHAITRFLIEHSPPQFQLIMATRVDPPFPLAKWRVSNEVNEVRISDLSFNRLEISLFLSHIADLELADQEISVLENRTEGWVAGLQLAALSLQNCGDIPSFIRAFAGTNRHIVDYLAEEVLHRQPDHIQGFLVQTAILDQMSSELCDYVTLRNDSRQILIDLDNDNLFTIPLDNTRTWYRYHHLFADLLNQRLQQTYSESVPQLHSRASKWYEQNNLIDNAIDHAFAARDYDRASVLIGSLFDTAWEFERKSRLDQWFEELPEEYIHERPNLCFFSAWVLTENANLIKAEKRLKRVEQLIDAGDETFSTRELQGKVAAMRALMATGRGDAPLIIELAEKALRFLPDEAKMWRANAYFTLGIAQTIKGDGSFAIRSFIEARKVSQEGGIVHLYLKASFWLISRLKYAGQLVKALAICEELFHLVKENGIENSVAGGAVNMMQGDLYYEQNKIDEAYHSMREDLIISEKCEDVAHKGWCYYGMMRILTAQNDISGAEEFIEKIENLKISFDLNQMVYHLTNSWKARIWLRKGEHSKVANWLDGKKITAQDKPLSAFQAPALIILARYLIVNNELDEAHSLLDRLLDDQEQNDWILLLIETLLIKAQALHKQGDLQHALQMTRKAIFLAEPGGYIRVFVDEGLPVFNLLEKLLPDKDIPRQFVKKLLIESQLSKHVTVDSNMVEQLTEREIEVLRCIVAGLSNKKITEELFISMSTVKTHLRNIYSKLGVNSRTQALAEAQKKALL
ncbi:LuxR C-terminal-related transcriptional regulator [Desulforhopalus sp. 52FAK]